MVFTHFLRGCWYSAVMKRLVGGFMLIVVLLVMLAGTEMSVSAAEQDTVTAVFVNQASEPARTWPGKEYSQVFTNEMAEEIAAWVLEAYPELPFKEPQVAIHEDGIVCSGVIEILGIDVEASGQISVFLDEGKLNGKIEAIEVAGMPVPGVLMQAIDDVRSLYDGVAWDIVVTKVELREGELLIEGAYK